jgi:hypothetical protein
LTVGRDLTHERVVARNLDAIGKHARAGLRRGDCVGRCGRPLRQAWIVHHKALRDARFSVTVGAQRLNSAGRFTDEQFDDLVAQRPALGKRHGRIGRALT